MSLSPSPEPDQPPSNPPGEKFLSLSVELLLSICELVVYPRNNSLKNGEHNISSDFWFIPDRYFMSPGAENLSILTVCRSLHPIAWRALYGKIRKLVLHLTVQGSQRFLQNVLPPELLQRIQDVRFTQHVSRWPKIQPQKDPREQYASVPVQDMLIQLSNLHNVGNSGA